VPASPAGRGAAFGRGRGGATNGDNVLNVRGLTRLLAVGAALAALAMAMPAQAAYSFSYAGVLGGMNGGGIFNSTLKENGSTIARYSVCNELGQTIRPNTVYEPISVISLTGPDARTAAEGGPGYRTIGPDSGTNSTLYNPGQANRGRIAWLVATFLRDYATSGDATKANALQHAVWKLWFVDASNNDDSPAPTNAGVLALRNTLLGYADGSIAYNGQAIDRATYTNDNVKWIRLAKDGPDNNTEEDPIQDQITIIPEAGALQFAAFAGFGALALLKRRRA